MLGAIIGDMVGSVYEFHNIKTTDFELITKDNNYTDDSVMTFAVADWLLNDKDHTQEVLTDTFVWFAHKYPCPMGGYGGSFSNWLTYPKTECVDVVREDGAVRHVIKETRKPYNSWGNGSAMRTSAIGWMFDTLEETERVAEIQASLTHNHPEGIKGAQATSAAIFMARTGKTKEEIKQYIETKYGYNLSQTCDQIRPSYSYDVSCQGTVPPAIIAFLESTDFESCLRLAVSLGGDCDTLTCISAGIAEAFYKSIPEWIVKEMWERLPLDFKLIIQKMVSETHYRIASYIPNTIVDSKINSDAACEPDHNIDNHLHVESDPYWEEKQCITVAPDTDKGKAMEKENKDGIINLIAIIVIGPLVFISQLPWIIKAFFRYISDKDKSHNSFYDHYTDVRHESKSFNKLWQEAAAKGIYKD